MPNCLKGQEGWEEIENYETSEIKEGLYWNFERFQLNSPDTSHALKVNQERLYVADSLGEWQLISAENVWGCFVDDKLYLAFQDRFWRCINYGSLMHFGALKTVFRASYDPYWGMSNVQKDEEGVQIFLDTQTGEVKNLNYRNLKPYLEQETLLLESVDKRKSNKAKSAVLLLKAYNELNPLKLSTHE